MRPPNGPTRTRFFALLAVAFTVSLAACGSSASEGDGASATTTTATSASTSSTTAAATATSTWPTTDLVLDPSKDYGDLYADGILPVGDGKVVLDEPEVGQVYLCHDGGDASVGGAQERGPWFINDNTEYDINQKIYVEGSVTWDGEYDLTVEGGERVIETNAVPDDHTTGEFPVASDDPAYQYDRNPNAISEQELEYRVTAEPELLDEPACMGGEVGVMVNGVPLFNALDAGNRDAGAWETQDDCDGHPQVTGEYHYHTLSACIDDVSTSTVIGWALDGFPITGPTVSDGNILTTVDLDECHGITSEVEIDGEMVEMYHYVMTQDFPYSVSCFRAEAAAAPNFGG